MRRRLSVFVVMLTVLVLLTYSYLAWSLTGSAVLRGILALPFISIWMIPVIYWARDREHKGALDQVVQSFAFLSMGWVSFALVLALVRDIIFGLARLAGTAEAWAPATEWSGLAVLGLSVLGVLIGGYSAANGPVLREIELRFPDLPQAFDGFRIVQISDLHVSSTIKRKYVERVVRMANEQKPDMVALTGDIIDGKLSDLRSDVEPLANLSPKGQVYFITGNHEYYSGAPEWLVHFKAQGFHVLENSHLTIERGGAKMMVAGVLDPASRMLGAEYGSDAEKALREGKGGSGAAFKVLLAHNPKIAPLAAPLGFDLQLSGHTHAGQFFPWTLVTRIVHAPHFAGLSRDGKMQVYVSAGTGTWGPPVRLGTIPELTVLKLVRGA